MNMKSTWMILIFWGLVGCSSTPTSPPAEARPPSRLPIGYVESPHAAEDVHGQWPVQGWALSEAGITAISIFVDRNYVGAAQLGTSRPDVQKAYPSFKNSAGAGWTYMLRTDNIPLGQHELVVQAQSADTTTRDIGAILINVIH
jgi:hypothetical protein